MYFRFLKKFMPVNAIPYWDREKARVFTEGANPGPSTSLMRGMLLLGLGTITVTGLTVVATRIYADRYGAADFSAILIFRLYGSVLLGVFGLGMPIAVQRNVAYCAATPGRAGTTALVGLGIGMGSFGIACLVSAMFASRIASLLGNAAAASVWRAFMALAFTQAFGNVVSLIQIARNRWIEASAITAAMMGVAPLLPLLALPHARLTLVLYLAAVASGIFAIPSFWEICRWSHGKGLSGVRQEASLLLRYGLPRALGNAAEPILDLMLPWLALLSGAGLIGAGGLAIGLALLRPLNPVTGAMGLVLTPSAAKWAAQGNLAAQGNQMRRVTEWALHIGLFATVQLVIWTDVLVVTWLGPKYMTAIWPVRIICLSLAPSFFYASARGIIDGENEKPINTLNLLLSMGVLLISAAAAHLLRFGEAALAICYFLSRVALGTLTLRYAIRTHAANLRKLRLGTAFSLTTLLGLLAVLVRISTHGDYGLAELAFLGPLSLALFIGGMGLRGTERAQVVLIRLRTAF